MPRSAGVISFTAIVLVLLALAPQAAQSASNSAGNRKPAPAGNAPRDTIFVYLPVVQRWTGSSPAGAIVVNHTTTALRIYDGINLSSNTYIIPDLYWDGEAGKNNTRSVAYSLMSGFSM